MAKPAPALRVDAIKIAPTRSGRVLRRSKETFEMTDGHRRQIPD